MKSNIESLQKIGERLQNKFLKKEKNLSEFVWFTDNFEDEEITTQQHNPLAPVFTNPFGVTTSKPRIFSSTTFLLG